MKANSVGVSILIFFCFTLFFSCNTIKTAAYDQYSYQKAIEIKVDASNLIEKSVYPFSDYSDDVNSLLIDVEKITLYEENRANNSTSYRMWKLLGNSEKNLLAGYLKKWEIEGKLSRVFMSESKPQIEQAMDMLIQYEVRKDRESKGKLMEILLGS